MADKILQAIYESAVDDVVLVRKFPPDSSDKPASFFGGLPRLPAEFDWPFSDYIGQHISFLAQIDLASLPAIQWRSRLPAEGTLFFFANTAFDRYEPDKDKWGHVLYCPRPCAHVGERQAPSDLMPIHGDCVAYFAKWIPHDDREFAPRLFPRWPVEPVVVRTFANKTPTQYRQTPLEEDFRDARSAEERRILDEAFGKPTPRRRLGDYYAAPDGGPSRLGPLPPVGYPLRPMVYTQPWLPDDDWPYSWIFAAIFCAQLQNNSHRYLLHPEPLEERAQSWREQALTGLFSPMPPHSREEFRAWVRSIPLETVPPTTRKGERLPSSYE